MKIWWVFDIGWSLDDDRAPGWTVPMGSMLIPTIACIVLLQFGFQPGLPVTMVAAIDSLIVGAFLRVRLTRVWQRGFYGLLRAGAWMDLAASCWVTWASAFSFLGVTRLRPLQLAPWQQAMVDGAGLLMQYLAPMAFACSLIGFTLGLLRRRPVHGPAMHVVAFFFWSAIALFGSMNAIPQNAAWPLVVGEIFGVLGVTTLIVAGGYALYQKRSPDQRSSDGRQ